MKNGYQIVDLGVVNTSGVETTITDENILNIFREINKNKNYSKPILLLFTSPSDKVSLFTPVARSDSYVLINIENVINSYNILVEYSKARDEVKYTISEI